MSDDRGINNWPLSYLVGQPCCIGHDHENQGQNSKARKDFGVGK